MQNIDLEKIMEVKSFAKEFSDMEIVSRAEGRARICSDKKEIVEMLLKCFDNKKSTPENCFFAVMDSEKVKRNLLSGNYEVDTIFIGKGISEYEFTVSHLFQLAFNENGLDYEELENSNFSIRFEYTDTTRRTNQIYEVACMEINHKKGEDPTQPCFTRGNVIPYIYNMENVISVLLGANSVWITYANRNDRAELFMDEIDGCSFKTSNEEVLKALKKNTEALKKIFNVSKLSDIYNLKSEEYGFNENVEEILKEASK